MAGGGLGFLIPPNVLMIINAFLVREFVGKSLASAAFRTPEQAEIRQLREDNRRLTMEKGILKKPPEPEAAGGFL
ncbi:hypothetical protein MIH18_15940 [Marinobacter sp. M3C]|uniref:hypothetical protein n=1 Tax=Marinobacter sp. M3C TaxID=2917715 RepID=UPI00200DE107|nr:hypothetical protein [Marinobacter sp. M3C]UQG59232.1 hypothetical protein MIH18_15940 [Marinobacter sp. M3C]